MHNHTFPNKIRNIAVMVFVASATSLVFAQESSQPKTSNCGSIFSPVKKEGLSALQEQARAYRDSGLQSQGIGDLGSAMSFYQKAVVLDPSYAIVYNDLGILYEATGDINRAEASYSKAITINPNYSSAYTNLAILYENKRDLKKAAFCWKKRSQLGPPGDPWTEKAKKRLADMAEVIPELKENLLEQETVTLIKDISEQKKAQDAKAKKQIALAKELYNKGEYDKATDELGKVLSLNSQNKDALVLMDAVQAKVMEKIKKASIQEMQKHFQEGLQYYQQNNLQAAQQEFGKLNELTVSPQKK